jgi:deoxyribodipyrimidine photo-lyase
VNIVWFRQDLRLADNPALNAACEAGEILPIYILDDVNAAEYKMGAASRVWLHHALEELNKQLDGQLQLFVGHAEDVFKQLCKQYSIDSVHWNRCYEPWRIDRDKRIKQQIIEQGVAAHSYGSLLWEPWTVLKKDGTHYQVFTPFFQKGCLMAQPPKRPLAKPNNIDYAPQSLQSSTLNQLNLLPTNKTWHKTMMTSWTPNEADAKQQLTTFIDNGLKQYKVGRDFPAKQSVTRLSPYLHFGQISPNQIWYALEPLEEDPQAFALKRELAWREFSYSLLYHLPQLPNTNLQAKFDRFAWDTDADSELLKAWQKGQTGYPIVDAGMRELWQTGYMHNRIRMVVASFLVKNLMLDWRLGRDWFWDTLVDADLASNSASWQWVAGCGVDAAPYFRIFNPVLQGEKFDKQGEYTRKYVPELASLPDKYLFKPWDAPQSVLTDAGILLGKHYPKPIVDIKVSREAALNAYQALKN